MNRKTKVSELYGRLPWGYFNDKIVIAAWCELRQAFRNFRVDRVRQLVLSQDVYPQFKQQLFRQWWEQEKRDSTTDRN